jgi:hypothetical protein
MTASNGGGPPRRAMAAAGPEYQAPAMSQAPGARAGKSSARGAAFHLDLQLHFLIEAILVAVVHAEVGAAE